MNSYERRLIHTAISESVFGILVKTESVGEGKERHTILRNK
ncbi:MAG: R3H domain-containing nucleic acid-binding protein [Culicoidibacterales bacterium]